MTSLENFLLSATPHPFKYNYLNISDAAQKITQEKLSLERLLHLEIFSHQNTKQTLTDTKRDLASCHTQLEDLRYDPFSVFSVNTELQRKLAESKLELEHTKSVIQGLNALLEKSQKENVKVLALEKQNSALRKEQTIYNDTTAKLHKELAYHKSNDINNQKQLMVYQKAFQEVNENTKDPPSSSEKKCVNCSRQSHVIFENAKLFEELKSEIVAKTSEMDTLNAVNHDLTTQISLERALNEDLAQKLNRLELEKKVSEVENGLKNQQMESYMSLNEDNQRKMLVQTKYLSDLTEKTVKQQTATTTILKNQVEELMGFFQEALELICTLQIDNEVSALERNRLRVLVRKEESDYQDQISLMQEEVEGIRATVESLVTDVQSNLQKHTTSTENGVDAILVKLEKALTACLDKKILVCESDFKLKNRTVMESRLITSDHLIEDLLLQEDSLITQSSLKIFSKLSILETKFSHLNSKFIEWMVCVSQSINQINDEVDGFSAMNVSVETANSQKSFSSPHIISLIVQNRKASAAISKQLEATGNNSSRNGIIGRIKSTFGFQGPSALARLLKETSNILTIEPSSNEVEALYDNNDVRIKKQTVFGELFEWVGEIDELEHQTHEEKMVNSFYRYVKRRDVESNRLRYQVSELKKHLPAALPSLPETAESEGPNNIEIGPKSHIIENELEVAHASTQTHDILLRENHPVSSCLQTEIEVLEDINYVQNTKFKALQEQNVELRLMLSQTRLEYTPRPSTDSAEIQLLQQNLDTLDQKYQQSILDMHLWYSYTNDHMELDRSLSQTIFLYYEDKYRSTLNELTQNNFVLNEKLERLVTGDGIEFYEACFLREPPHSRFDQEVLDAHLLYSYLNDAQEHCSTYDTLKNGFSIYNLRPSEEFILFKRPTTDSQLILDSHLMISYYNDIENENISLKAENEILKLYQQLDHRSPNSPDEFFLASQSPTSYIPLPLLDTEMSACANPSNNTPIAEIENISYNQLILDYHLALSYFNDITYNREVDVDDEHTKYWTPLSTGSFFNESLYRRNTYMATDPPVIIDDEIYYQPISDLSLFKSQPLDGNFNAVSETFLPLESTTPPHSYNSVSDFHASTESISTIAKLHNQLDDQSLLNEGLLSQIQDFQLSFESEKLKYADLHTKYLDLLPLHDTASETLVECSSLKHEIEKLSAKIIFLEAAKADLASKLATAENLANQHEDLRRLYDESVASIELLSNNVARLEEEVLLHSADKERLGNSLKALQKHLAEVESNVNESELRNCELRDKLSSLENLSVEPDRELSRQTEFGVHIKIKDEHGSSQLSALQTELVDRVAETEKLSSLLEAAKTDLAAKLSSAENLANQHESLRRKYDEAVSSNELLSNNVARLEEEVSLHSADKERLENSLKAVQQQLAEVESNINEGEMRNCELRDKVASLENLLVERDRELSRQTEFGELIKIKDEHVSSQLSALQTELVDRVAETEKLSSKILLLEAAKTDLTTRLSSAENLVNQNESLRRQYDEALNSNELLTNNVARLEEEISLYSADKDRLENSLKAVQQHLAEVESNINEGEMRNCELRDKVASLENLSVERDRDLSRQIEFEEHMKIKDEHVSSQLSALQTELVDRVAEIEKLSSKILLLEAAKTDLTTRLSSAENLVNQNESLRRQYDEALNSNELLTNNVARLEEEISLYSTDKDRLENSLKAVQQHLAEVESNINEGEMRNCELRDKVASLENLSVERDRDLSRQIEFEEHMKIKDEHVSSQLSALQTELVDRVAEIEKLSSKILLLEAAKTDLTTRLSSAENLVNQNESLRRQYDEALNSNDLLTNNVARLEEEISLYSADKDRLENSLKAVQQQLAEVESNINEVEMRNCELRDKVSRVENLLVERDRELSRQTEFGEHMKIKDEHVSSQLSALQTELVDRVAETEKLSSKILLLEAAKTDLTTRLSSAENLVNQNESLRRQYDEALNSNELLTNNVARLEEEISLYSADKDRLENSLKAVQQHLAEVESNINEGEMRNCELRDKVSRVENLSVERDRELSRQIEFGEHRKFKDEHVSSQLPALQNELTGRVAETEKLSSKILLLEAAKTDLTTRLSSAENLVNQNESLRRQYDEALNSNELLTNDSEVKSDILRDERDEVSPASGELLAHNEDNISKLTALDILIGKLKIKNDRHDKEISSFKSELSSSHSKNSQISDELLSAKAHLVELEKEKRSIEARLSELEELLHDRDLSLSASANQRERLVKGNKFTDGLSQEIESITTQFNLLQNNYTRLLESKDFKLTVHDPLPAAPPSTDISASYESLLLLNTEITANNSLLLAQLKEEQERSKKFSGLIESMTTSLQALQSGYDDLLLSNKLIYENEIEEEKARSSQFIKELQVLKLQMEEEKLLLRQQIESLTKSTLEYKCISDSEREVISKLSEDLASLKDTSALQQAEMYASSLAAASRLETILVQLEDEKKSTLKLSEEILHLKSIVAEHKSISDSEKREKSKLSEELASLKDSSSLQRAEKDASSVAADHMLKNILAQLEDEKKNTLKLSEEIVQLKSSVAEHKSISDSEKREISKLSRELASLKDTSALQRAEKEASSVAADNRLENILAQLEDEKKRSLQLSEEVLQLKISAVEHKSTSVSEKREIPKLSRELSSLKDSSSLQLAEKDASSVAADHMLKNILAQLEDEKKNTLKLSEEIVQLKSSVAEHKSISDSEKREISKLSEELASLKDSSSLQRAEKDASSVAADHMLKSILAQLEDEKKRSLQLSEEVLQLKISTVGHKSTSDSEKREISKLSRELASIKDTYALQRAEKEASSVAADKMLKNILADLEYEKKSTLKLSEEIVQLKSSVAEHKSISDSEKREISKLSEELASLRDSSSLQRAEKDTSSVAADHMLKSILAQLEDEKKRSLQLSEEVVHLKSNAVEHKSMSDSDKREISKLSEELASLKDTSALQQAEIHASSLAADNRLENILAQLEDEKKNTLRLCEEIVQLKSSGLENKSISEYKTQHEALSSQLDQCKAELSKSHRSLQTTMNNQNYMLQKLQKLYVRVAEKLQINVSVVKISSEGSSMDYFFSLIDKVLQNYNPRICLKNESSQTPEEIDPFRPTQHIFNDELLVANTRVSFLEKKIVIQNDVIASLREEIREYLLDYENNIWKTSFAEKMKKPEELITFLKSQVFQLQQLTLSHGDQAFKLESLFSKHIETLHSLKEDIQHAGICFEKEILNRADKFNNLKNTMALMESDLNTSKLENVRLDNHIKMISAVDESPSSSIKWKKYLKSLCSLLQIIDPEHLASEKESPENDFEEVIGKLKAGITRIESEKLHLLRLVRHSTKKAVSSKKSKAVKKLSLVGIGSIADICNERSTQTIFEHNPLVLFPSNVPVVDQSLVFKEKIKALQFEVGHYKNILQAESQRSSIIIHHGIDIFTQTENLDKVCGQDSFKSDGSVTHYKKMLAEVELERDYLKNLLSVGKSCNDKDCQADLFVEKDQALVISSLRETISVYENSLNETTKQLSDLNTQCQLSRTKMASLEDDNSILNKQLILINNDLISANRAKESVESDLAQLEERSNLFESQRNSAWDLIIPLQEKINQNDAEISFLYNKLDSYGKSDVKFTLKSKDIDNISIIDEQKVELDLVKKELSNSRGKEIELEREIDSLTKEIGRLKLLEVKWCKIQKKNIALKTELVKLRQSKNDITADNANLNQTICHLESEMGSLKQENSRVNELNHDLNIVVSELNKQLDDLKQDFHALTGKCDLLENEKNVTASNIFALQESYNKVVQEKNLLSFKSSDDIHRLSETKIRLESERNVALDKIKFLENAYNKSISELNNVSHLPKISNEIHVLTEKLAQSESERKAAQDKIHFLGDAYQKVIRDRDSSAESYSSVILQLEKLSEKSKQLEMERDTAISSLEILQKSFNDLDREGSGALDLPAENCQQLHISAEEKSRLEKLETEYRSASANVEALSIALAKKERELYDFQQLMLVKDTELSEHGRLLESKREDIKILLQENEDMNEKLMNYYKSAYQHQKRTTEFTLKSKCTMTEKLPVSSISAISNDENVLASLKKEYDQTILAKENHITELESQILSIKETLEIYKSIAENIPNKEEWKNYITTTVEQEEITTTLITDFRQPISSSPNTNETISPNPYWIKDQSFKTDNSLNFFEDERRLRSYSEVDEEEEEKMDQELEILRKASEDSLHATKETMMNLYGKQVVYPSMEEVEEEERMHKELEMFKEKSKQSLNQTKEAVIGLYGNRTSNVDQEAGKTDLELEMFRHASKLSLSQTKDTVISLYGSRTKNIDDEEARMNDELETFKLASKQSLDETKETVMGLYCKQPPEIDDEEEAKINDELEIFKRACKQSLNQTKEVVIGLYSKQRERDDEEESM